MPRVAVDIVTGFLGSGKTSLLRHVLERGLSGHRVAVIVNEIGDIGIDGTEIQGAGIERMVELTSGCVCCQ
ncbi:MAG: GTP-binding protein, partial [Planctomycetota bacterium]